MNRAALCARLDRLRATDPDAVGDLYRATVDESIRRKGGRGPWLAVDHPDPEVDRWLAGLTRDELAIVWTESVRRMGPPRRR